MKTTIQLSIEIVFLVIIIFSCILIVIITGQQKCHKRGTWVTVSLALLVLLASFFVIHLGFCYQVGFPASTEQSKADLALKSADWLSFLGSYLTFSGSLVMAFVVYRQSRILNEFMISEYSPSMSIIICACKKSTDIENFKSNNILQVLPKDYSEQPKDCSEQFYTFHCDLDEKCTPDLDVFGLLVFVEIYNYSKSILSELTFKGLEFTDIKTNDLRYKYINRGGAWDPADKITKIFPGKRLKRCFYIEKIPAEFDICRMKICFECAENQHLDTIVLVSKARGQTLTFVGVSEPF